MQNKKVDALQFQAAVAEAKAYLTVAFELLAPFLVVLSNEERLRVLRTRAGFPDAGRNLALAIAKHPTVAQAAAYDPIAVGECFDNVDQLDGLVMKLGELAQRIADSRLVWLADAWRPSLRLRRREGARDASGCTALPRAGPLARLREPKIDEEGDA